MVWGTTARVLALATERGGGEIPQEVLEGAAGPLGRVSLPSGVPARGSGGSAEFAPLRALSEPARFSRDAEPVGGFSPLPARRMTLWAGLGALRGRAVAAPLRAHPVPRRGSPAAAAAPGAGAAPGGGGAHGAGPRPSPQPRPRPLRAGSGSRAIAAPPGWLCLAPRPLPSIARGGGAGPVLTVRISAPRAARSASRSSGKVIPAALNSTGAAPGAPLCLSPRLSGTLFPKKAGKAAQKKRRPTEDVRGGEGRWLFARCVPPCLSFPCVNPLGRSRRADRAFLEGRCCRALPRAGGREMRGPGRAAGECEELPPPSPFREGKSMGRAGPDPWSAAPLSRRWDYSGVVMESYNLAAEC